MTPRGDEFAENSLNSAASSSSPDETAAGDAIERPKTASRSFASPSITSVSQKSEEKPRSRRTIDEMLLFFPSKHPEGNWQPAGLDIEDVWFESADGVRLHGWLVRHDNPKAVILFAHGNGGNVALWAGAIKHLHDQLRATVFAFDYRGYGQSEGKPTVPGVLSDARAARTTLSEEADIDERGILLVGKSLGGAVVIQLAAEKPPIGLVVQSSFSSLKEVAVHHFPRLAWIVPKDKLDSKSAIARYNGPLLLSHGDADETIPFTQGERLFQAANEPKRFVAIPGGDHNDPPTPAYTTALKMFVSQLPKPDARAGAP